MWVQADRLSPPGVAPPAERCYTTADPKAIGGRPLVTLFERRGVWFLALIAIVAAAAMACGDGNKASPEPTPTATGGPLSTTTPGATSGSELPEGILQDFPVYPGAELVESEIEEAKVTAVLDTGDSREDVARFYEEALAEAPWDLQTVVDADEETTLVLFSGRDNPDINGTAAITVPPDGDGTEIIVEIILASGVTLTPTPVEG